MSVIRWLIGRIMRLVPEAILARMLPGMYRYHRSEIPAPPSAPDAPVRLYVAPVNWAGQGWQWSRAAERYVDGVGAVNMAYSMPTDFRYPADCLVPIGAYAFSRRWQRGQFDAVRHGFTHVIVEAERRPFGAVADESVESQVRRLLDARLAVAMLCHGSDIRLPSRHAAVSEYSPFRGLDPQALARLERVVRRNHTVLEKLSLPTFVSTPDLLLDVPGATWLPVVVEPDRWATETVPLERKRPVVVHAPSHGHIKGSDLIDPILRRLEEEGLVEYHRVTGVAVEEMPAVYRDADIVLDQFRIGGYGVAAVEAMAAGRILVSHVSEQVRGYVTAMTGLELPIIEAPASGLEAALRDIVRSPEPYRRLAQSGVEFSRTVHDGRMSAKVLESFLLA